MSGRGVDLEKVCVALRRLSRGNLLLIAERAVELVPRAKLSALVGDLVRLDEVSKEQGGAAPLLREVQKFHAASLRGEYYEDFAVNSKNFMHKSGGNRDVHRRVRPARWQVRPRRPEAATGAGA